MAGTGTINVSVFNAARQSWAGPEVRLVLTDPLKSQAGLLSADIDIDLLTDIGHFGEVIKNKITKLKTDPFTVYTLLFDQGIRPLYTLKA